MNAGLPRGLPPDQTDIHTHVTRTVSVGVCVCVRAELRMTYYRVIALMERPVLL